VEEQANVGRFTKLPLHNPAGLPVLGAPEVPGPGRGGEAVGGPQRPGHLGTPGDAPDESAGTRRYIKDDQFRVSNRQATDWSKVVRIAGEVDETVWMKVMWS
jgi:hypothetical protein